MRDVLVRILLVAALGAGAPPTVRAADDQATRNDDGSQVPDFTKMSLEQLLQVEVVSASKFLQTAAQAPSSVTVITSEDILRYGYRSVAEILAGATGFYVNNDRNYASVGVRGFGQPGDYNSKLLVLINGHRINDPVYEGAYVDLTFPVDVAAIDRVEIARGPSSSLYGTNAFFGVVNVITRTGEAVGGVEVAADAASYGTVRGGVNAGAKTEGGVDVAVSGSWYDSRGQRLYFEEFDSPSTDFGVADRLDAERAGKVMAQASYRDVSIQGGVSSRIKHLSTGAFDTAFGDARNRTVDAFGFLSVAFQRSLSDTTALSANLYYDRYAYDGTYVYADAAGRRLPVDVVEYDQGRGQRWGAEIKVDRLLFSRHRVTAGVEFRNTFQADQHATRSQEVLLNDDRASVDGGVYLQDEVRVHPTLTLNMGVRYDRYQSFGGTTNPRAAAIYTPQPGTTVKAIYGQAFRAPNAYELYFHDGSSVTANPFLQPERIKTAELIVERQFGPHVQATASGYHYWIKGLIAQAWDEASASLQYANVRSVAANGASIEVAGRWSRGFMGRASYSFQNASDTGSDVVLTNMPRHLIKLHVGVPVVGDRMYSGVEATYVSGRTTSRGTETASRWLTNAVVSSRRRLGGMTVSVGLYNLFDQRYADPAPGWLPEDRVWQDGRNIRVSVAYAFGAVR
ncbi:MAG: TonB-dependent receptor [Acidobacteriota bacterium]